MLLVLVPLLFGLSFLSGMLGLLSRIFALALILLAAQRAWILLT